MNTSVAPFRAPTITRNTFLRHKRFRRYNFRSWEIPKARQADVSHVWLF